MEGFMTTKEAAEDFISCRKNFSIGSGEVF